MLSGECCAHKATWNCAAPAAIAESSLESEVQEKEEMVCEEGRNDEMKG